MHASASNDKVTTREFADKTIPNGGPTHYGLVSGVDYGVGNDMEIVDKVVDNRMDNVASSKPQRTPQYSHLVFKEGCKGNGPREIQVGLNKPGYSLIVDGEFGPLTEEAVIKFQTAQGLEADGIVGKDTWAVLTKSVNSV
jgi:hypothetical protein